MGIDACGVEGVNRRASTLVVNKAFLWSLTVDMAIPLQSGYHQIYPDYQFYLSSPIGWAPGNVRKSQVTILYFIDCLLAFQKRRDSNWLSVQGSTAENRLD